MDDQVFIYDTYVATTRERLWDALTNPDTTEQFWSGNRLISDWAIGSPVRLLDGDMVRDEGEVLDFVPCQRMSFSWKPHFAIEFAAEQGTPIAFAESEAGHETRVGFAISEFGPQLRLTLTHDHFAPDSKLFPIISFGWPFYMASLKSLLESGAGLELPAGAKVGRGAN